MLDLVKLSIRRLAGDRRGISAIEYGILGAVVVVALVAVGPDLTTAVENSFGRLTGALN